MLETGDPLAGTERNEASAKNIGMLISKGIIHCNNRIKFHVKRNLANEPSFHFLALPLLSPRSRIIPPFQFSNIPVVSPRRSRRGPVS
jgi:hypothetical protein